MKHNANQLHCSQANEIGIFTPQIGIFTPQIVVQAHAWKTNMKTNVFLLRF